MSLDAPAPSALRPLPRSRLGQLVPPLCAEQALVALVPITGNLHWAAEAAWEVARAAALGGVRRVALVDLGLEEPRLHEIVGLTPTDGIVDAFEYDVSLTKAAHAVDGVYFIAAGSYTAQPGSVFGHTRWPKLQAGFRAEGALLLLFVSAAALAQLSAVPDGVLVLAPDGCDIGSTDVLARRAPLLGVVRERWVTAPPAAAAPPPRARRVRPGVAALALAVGGAGSYALLALPVEGPAAPSEARETRAPAPSPPAPVPAVDSVPWTIQLAAYGTLERALAQADELGEEGVRALVTPVVLGGSGTLWYRVLAGAYSTRDSAATARESLWQRGVAPRGEGELLYAPYSWLLAAPAGTESLRQLGLAGVPWGRAGRVLLGAFETPEQAGPAGAQLERAGLRATLVTRMGPLP